MTISLWSWIIAAVIVVAILAMIGLACRKGALGVLVDARNKMSLSRLQIVVWTIVFVSSFFTVAFQMRTIDIYLAPELWALLAITTGSTAGAVIVKGAKGQQDPPPELEAVEDRVGVLATAFRPRFADLFTGDELANENTIDISKVQMFFFTVAAVFGYVLALLSWDLKSAPAANVEMHVAYFPMLSTAIVTLLGISHAGYLTVKAAPHPASERRVQEIAAVAAERGRERARAERAREEELARERTRGDA